MDKLLDGISVKGIIKPGEVYVFTESESRLDEISGPGLAYTIRSDDELRAALAMEVYLILPVWCDIKDYIGCIKLSDDCYVFQLLIDHDFRPTSKIYSKYLHRVIQFKERLAQVNSDLADVENV
ncbi:hypothetical protein [Puia dinghuensis]|uniref:Uncharacterized protein n=1 Tax=Puia dinghuensis TaxID=1792502 RepID=A0A8J2UIP0_9BACT|nr:hypothetical protein [Puia dinghuensis]GGB23831.1 hypothetical protein GCM10011511_54640 [Puia dinghuensis]